MDAYYKQKGDKEVVVEGYWVWGRATEMYDHCGEYFGLGPLLLVMGELMSEKVIKDLTEEEIEMLLGTVDSAISNLTTVLKNRRQMGHGERLLAL